MENNHSKTPIRVLHLITGLNTGGAEMALYRLLVAMNRQEFQSSVVSLIKPGPVGDLITEMGIPVKSLEMPPGRASIRGFYQLIRILKDFQPDILQTWMYHADFLGLMAGKLTGVPAIAWNIRGSEMNFMNSQGLSRIIAKTCALVSGWPQVVLVNSRAGIIAHEKLNYHPRRWQFIPNGIDTEKFLPDRASGQKNRARWNIPLDCDLIGMVARLDPQKGHTFFLQAAAIVLKEKPDTHFICIGGGPENFLEELKKQAEGLGLGTAIHWIGNQSEMPSVYNALNIYISPSAYGEGFPNVIAEAMACGIPCIATKTGDAPDLLASTGLIVPPQNSQSLAEAILKVLNTPPDIRALIGANARERIISNFNMDKMAGAYSDIYGQILGSNTSKKSK